MNPEKKNPSGGHLTLYICVSIVLAIVVALVFPGFAMKFHVGGEVFLRMLKMVVVPLVVASVMCGILGMGDVRKLGRPGGYAILYYISTTVLAVFVGLIVVNTIKPGVGAIDKETLDAVAAEGDVTSARAKVLDSLSQTTGLSSEEVASVFGDLPAGEKEQPSIATILNNLLLMLFTENLFESAAKTDLLPLIVFSIVFAGLLTTMGSKVSVITQFLQQTNTALMAFVLLLMKIAPLGIFCLVTARFGEAKANGELLQVLAQTGKYVLSVLVGLGIHTFLTLPLIYWLFTRKNPYRFMARMAQPLLTAFSTASSSATLPVTMECAVEKGGVSKQSSEFVLPLGATINMDGTALYEAAAAIFIAQAIGVDLTLFQQLTIAMTATLAAIGAAGIPEAGLVTMVIVLNAVGLPVEYIGLILSVDWLLDRFRTAANVCGDSIGAAVIDQAFADPGKVATPPAGS